MHFFFPLVLLSFISSTHCWVQRGMRCYHCVYYSNSDLPSVKNNIDVCRPGHFRMPMLVETCQYGCVISIIYHDESEFPQVQPNLPRFVQWLKNETFPLNVNVTLPPMVFYLRGCAKSLFTHCIMDMSRPGVFHQDCFCHSNFCNGKPKNNAMTKKLDFFSVLFFIFHLIFNN